MSLSSTVRALVDAGATPAMILAVVEAHEATQADKLEARRAHDAERQKAKRERDSHVMSRDPSTVTRTVSSRTRVELASLPSLRSEEVRTPKLPLVATPRKAKPLSSRRCPDDWQPNPVATIAKLEAEGYSPGDLERAMTRMRDHEFKSPRSDWDAAFRNWVRSDPQSSWPANVRPHHDKRQTPREDRLQRVLNGVVAAVDRRSG